MTFDVVILIIYPMQHMPMHERMSFDHERRRHLFLHPLYYYAVVVDHYSHDDETKAMHSPSSSPSTKHPVPSTQTATLPSFVHWATTTIS